VDRFFLVSQRKSRLPVEIVGGVSTFFALSYIVVVNPAILAAGGVPRGAAFFATAVVAGLASLVMGLWAKLPLAVAPGMEMNAFVAFTVVGVLGFTWQQALGLVFWSGVLMLVVSWLKLRDRVIAAIPPAVRTGLGFTVGLFIGLIGLQIADVLVGQDGRVVGVGSLTSPAALACFLGLAVALGLDRLRVPGAVLISVLLATVFLLVVQPPGGAVEAVEGGWFSALGALDLGAIFNAQALAVVLILFALDFFGSVAKVIGLSTGTSIVADGSVPGMRQALLTDAGATVAGAAAGSTSFVAYVESAVGIRAGARTGLAACVVGVLMLASLASWPLLARIPTAATAGALLFVAIKMIPSRTELRGLTSVGYLEIVAMVAIILTTSALDQALLGGLVVHLVAGAIQRRRPPWILVAATIVLGFCVAVRYFGI
jgi:AGZA family xanthine/uracil permease-like MFS transporter